MSSLGQLTLSVQLPDDETFASYIRLGQSQTIGKQVNADVVQSLQSFLQSYKQKPSKQHSFYLFGLTGVGKSHLLHASCTYADELGLTAQCISLAELYTYRSDILVGLEVIDLICIDDIHLIANNPEWEQAIFDLFNRITENNKCLIISGNNSIAELGIQLPDLISRLSWGLVEQLKPLTDDEKVLALQFRAQQRGLVLSEESAKFLLNHLSRSMKSLIKSLDTLDRASIKEQRKITIPFIKEVLLSDN